MQQDTNNATSAISGKMEHSKEDLSIRVQYGNFSRSSSDAKVLG